ncbi:hypothetical protein [Thermospira aquatica]|uniref:YggT family protein n=1 Tax=Thermospira aquatica TaxID=2828656 RepID=A0AAX3BCX4_9SPIR|nr:hypothetical protein [Thermospira aquatica]URA10000.1 hypothetical protein KDW03_11040 [Thermospira aquatica]
MKNFLYDYLDIILVVLVVAGGWMVYRIVIQRQEFQERWENLPEETKMFILERQRHPFLRMVWTLLRRDMDVILAGVVLGVMLFVLLWVL